VREIGYEQAGFHWRDAQVLCRIHGGFYAHQKPFTETAMVQVTLSSACGAAVAASKAWYESAQSIAKSQADFYQKQAEQFQAAASKAFSNGSKPEDSIESTAKLAQKSIDANLKNTQEVAKSASETAVEVFDILNKQAVKNINEISSLAKQAS
jgi:hypothetical protein